MDNSKTNSQNHSIANVGVINAIAAIIGIAQAILIGRLFGTSKPIEIYFAAVVFYQSVVNLLQTGQLVEIATPIYHKLKATVGPKEADIFYSSLLNLTVLFSLIATTILFFIAPFVIHLLVPGFNSEHTGLCLEIFCWILPCMSLQVICSLLTNWLAADKKFVIPELAKICFQALNLVLIILLSPLFGVWTLVITLWTYNLLLATTMAFFLLKKGACYRPVLFDEHGEALNVLKRLPNIFLYVGTTQFYAIALNAGLTMLPAGAIAVVNYARRLSSRINGLVNRPISLVFFNHFSVAFSLGSNKVRLLIREALDTGLFVTIIISVIVITAGFPGMCALWLSKQFDVYAIFHTYLITSALSLVTMASITGIIYRKINMTRQRVQQQYLALTLIQVCCGVYAYCLMPSLGFVGLVAIILVNPLSFAVASGILLYCCEREMFEFYNFRNVQKYFACAVLATTPILALQFWLYAPSIQEPLINFLVAASCGLIAVVIFLTTACLFKIPQASKILNTISK